jgi:dynactin 1
MDTARGDFEGKETELLEQLEMAALDREVAEEKAETLMTELADMKELVETLKIEVEVLKEENAVYDSPIQPGDENSKLAFIQMEKRSERLAEALFKLQSDNKAQQSRIAELERQGDATDALQARLANANTELENAQVYIDDLKQQLDNALGAEEMLEQLTDRTLSMGEKIEEMRITIEDLEALKEMADELEYNHMENEGQLEEQISVLESRLKQEEEQAEGLVQALTDRESTIEQFRELVSRMQDEVHSLRDQADQQQGDNTDIVAQSQVVLNLNLKLQTSVIKNRARAVDLALSKLELDQAKEHAAIMHQYLPDHYFLADAAATEALLFLQRLAGKAELLINTFCEIHNLPDALQEARDDALVGVCELRGSLSEFATFTRRFAGIMRRSTPDEYIGLAPVRLELSAIERKVDLWFDQIRQDEFVEKDCAADLNK